MIRPRPNTSACTLAYWHNPRFSSGVHGNDVSMDAIWDLLYQQGVDVVVNGHDPLVALQPNSEAWIGDTFGVLKLTLHDSSYNWVFVPEAGKTFTDTGSSAFSN